MRGAYSRSRLSVSYHRNIVAYNMHCDGYSLINNKFVQWTSVPLTENPQRFVSFINCWFSFEKNPTSAIIFDLIQQCFVLDFVESIVIYNVWQQNTNNQISFQIHWAFDFCFIRFIIAFQKYDRFAWRSSFNVDRPARSAGLVCDLT